MPLTPNMKAFGSYAATLLPPGEPLLVMGSYDEPAMCDESRFERSVDEVDPGNHPNWDGFVRVSGGLCGEGGVESWAGRMWRVTSSLSEGFYYYAVTDRRVLLIGRERMSLDFRIHFEAPRSAISSIRRKGKPFQRGRVELRFVDGSMKAFLTGTLSARQARRLVAALSEPGGD